LIDFRPHAAEPIILHWSVVKANFWGKVLPALPLAAVAFILCFESVRSAYVHHSAAGSSAGSGGMINTLCSQMSLLATKITSPKFCKGIIATPSFSISHDAFSILTMILLAVGTYTARYQWSGYAKLISHMTRFGSLTFPSRQGRRELEKKVRAANRFFERLSKFALFILASICILVLLLALEQHRRGVFAALAPSNYNVDKWSKAAYAGWWLLPTRAPEGAVVYFAVGILELYIVTIQNIVGFRILHTMWQSRDHFAIAADYVNSDGYYGWEPIRRILSATYLQIAIHGSALAAIGIMLPPGGITSPVFDVAAGQWILTLPFYILWPIILTRQKVLVYKERQIDFLATEVRRLARRASRREALGLEEDYADRLEKVRKIPSLPYRRPRDSMFFMIGFIADFSAVIAIIATLA
jgi:hypothetical protein